MRFIRRHVTRTQRRRLAAISAAALACSLFGSSSTQNAVANGDTRTLNLYHSHTGESIQATFRVNGVYDSAVLEQLNYFLRDWRNNDRTRMDPRLFDVVWEVYRTAGASQPIVIYSAYRSPETNAMLRRRSSAVAEYSQHMRGKAMDTTMPGMSMEQIREIGIKLQRGGVGYYSRENFVHLDVGNVRSWPRLSYEALARLFPDGKSAHLASNGRSLPRYEEARAEIASRGGVVGDTPVAMPGGSFFAWLLGGGRDRQEQSEAVRGAMPGRGPAAPAAQPGTTQVAALEKPARMTAAERRAAAKAAKAAPALAAIAAANPPDESAPGAAIPSNANRTLIAALAPRPVAPQPQFAVTPTPIPRERTAEPAPSGAAADSLVTQEAPQEKAEPRKPLFAQAPLPPARPDLRATDDQMIAYADAPTPPARPANLIQLASLPGQAEAAPPADVARGAAAAKGDPARSEAARTNAALTLARAASLPVVITRGPRDRQTLPASALGYAAGTATGPWRRAGVGKSDGGVPEIVSARLDRSNFRELTAQTPAAEATSSSLLGQALTGLRQAARIIPDALSAAPSGGYRMAFGAASAIPETSSFAKPAADAATSVSISDASQSAQSN